MTFSLFFENEFSAQQIFGLLSFGSAKIPLYDFLGWEWVSMQSSLKQKFTIDIIDEVRVIEISNISEI